MIPLSQDIDPVTGRTYEEVCRRCHTACGQPHSDGQSTRDQKLACGQYCLQHIPGDKQCTAACEAYDDNLLGAGFGNFDQMCSSICEGDNLICHSACDLGPACHGSDKQISCNDCKDDCYSCVDPLSGRTASGCIAECTANACGETTPVR